MVCEYAWLGRAFAAARHIQLLETSQFVAVEGKRNPLHSESLENGRHRMEA